MILKPFSFYGTSLSSTDYEASFPRAMANLQMETSAGYIKRAGTVPVFSGKEFLPTVLKLEIIMQHDFMTLFESLNQLFDTKDETPRQFICQDTEDSNKQYYVYATAKQVFGGNDGPMAVVTLALDDPIWQSVTQNSQTWSITSTTSTTDVTNNGNDYAFPIFEITPTSATSTDYAYQVPLQVIPTSANPWSNRFLDITGSTDTTFDTAALVAAGKMQADGDDLRVYRDGLEVDRWLNGINTTDTHVIVTANMPPKYQLSLKTAIASTDTVTEIEANNTTANRDVITAMPGAGRFIICTSLGSTDTEEFAYTAKTVTDTKLALTVNARAVRNTTALAHAANDPVYHVPYDFTLAYGNATVSAPVTDDTRKPIVDLTSRNWSFVFNDFKDAAFLRPHSWANLTQASSAYLTRSGVYTSTNDEGDTDPATVMGIKAKTYENFGVWRSDSVVIYWYNQFPDYISSLSASGSQNQSVASIPTTFMRAWNESGAVTDLWTISAQATTDYSTWTAWSKATTDATLPSSAISLNFMMLGTILGSTDYYSKAEIDTLTLGLTNYPDVRIRSEITSATKIDCVISNDTTGDSIQVTYILAVNDTIYVDTDPNFPTAKHNGQIINGIIKTSTIRTNWLKLNPGSNTLSYNSSLSAANNVTIITKWRDRMNFL